jgi:hypothetical protein
MSATEEAKGTPPSKLVRVLDRFGIHYGCAVAGAAFVTLLATAGALDTARVMIEPRSSPTI